MRQRLDPKGLQKRRQTLRRWVQSEQGKEALEVLSDMFYDGDLRRSDPNNTYYALGQRDVVVMLKELADSEEVANELVQTN